jgi:hypothetical protein
VVLGLALPRKEMRFLTMEVVDWAGPIVEIRFNLPVETDHDVEMLLVEANSFMRIHVVPRAYKAYFVTCYDNLRFSREALIRAREGFAGFNERFSLGDVRYGGDAATRTFIIAQSIETATSSAIFETRKQALDAIRAKMAK